MSNNSITELDRKGHSVELTLNSPKGNEYKMTAFEASRWCAMLEAVEVIDKKIIDLKMSSNTNWVKPIAIQKYIDEKYQDILYDMFKHDKIGEDQT